MGAAGLTRKRLDLMRRKAVVVEKAGKRYDVYFTEETAEALTAWLKRRPVCDHDFVFCEVRKPHRKLSNPAVSQIIRRLCIKAGVGSYGSHAFRHAMGHDLQDTTEATTAALVMGHSNPETTINFYYAKSRKRAEAASRLVHRRRSEKQRDKLLYLRRSS